MDIPVKIINNITETVKDDLVTTLKKGSKVSIAAACFSMYDKKNQQVIVVCLPTAVTTI